MQKLLRSRAWSEKVVSSTWVLLAITSLSGGRAFAASVTLDPIKDTYVSQNAGSSNYGSNTTASLGDFGCGTCAAGLFLQYDLSSIPAGATLVTATLSFKKAADNHTGLMAVSVRNRANSWTEGGVTWNNSSPLADPIVGSASINTDIDYPVITDGPLFTLVQGWMSNPGSNRGLSILPGVMDSTYISFHTKEASGQQPIRLVVGYSVPQAPPTVTTNAATGVGQAAATLNGVVNPNGAATTAYFDYGLSSGNLNQTVTYGSVGSGNSNVATSSQISGLSACTAYYFRARASNSGGTTNGDTLSFMTGCVSSPAVTTSAATGVGQTSATLNGFVNPNGSSTIAYFDFGLSSGNLNQTVTYGSVGSGNSALAISSQISGLTACTTYYFRARATNGGGTTNGSTLTFSTSCSTGVFGDGFESGNTSAWSFTSSGALLVDDFNDGSTVGWAIPNGGWSEAGGVFWSSGTWPNSSMPAISTSGASWGNYRAEVDAKFDDIWCATSMQVYLRYQSDSDRCSCQLTYCDSSSSTISISCPGQGATSSTAFLIAPGIWYRLRGEVVGSSASCEVVGSPASRVEVTNSGASGSGTVGLESTHVSGEFDNLLVEAVP